MGESTKAKTKEITTPTGLSGVIRRLTVGELDSFASAKKQRKGISIDKVLQSIWLETLDFGIYKEPFVDFIERPDWQRVLDSERNWILREVRKLQLGSDLYFRKGCPSILCGEPINCHINLDDLETEPPSAEALEQLRTTGENLFFRTLPFSGDKVGFKLLQGSDMAIAARIAQQNSEDLASATLLLRLAYIECAKSANEMRKFAVAMDSDDMEWLQDEWRAADLWTDDLHEVQCPRCRALHEVEVPYDARFFSRRSARPPKKSGS